MLRAAALAALVCIAQAVPADRETTTAWCQTNEACRDAGDSLAFCSPVTNACVCSEGYGPINVHGEWKWYGCYAETRKVAAAVSFTDGACKATGSLSVVVRQGVVSALEAVTQGRVTGMSYSCEKLIFVATLDVKVANLSSLPGAAQGITAAVTSTPLLWVPLGSQVSVSAWAAASVLPAPLASAVAPTPAPAATGQPAACTAEGAVEAFSVELRSGTYCQPTRCNTSFVLVQRPGGVNSTGFDCMPMPTEEASCLVDGDCSWDAAKTVCAGSACVEPTYPSKNTSVAVKATSVHADACTVDADCQQWKDSSSTCVTRDVQANYCECGPLYTHLSPEIPVCVPNTLATARMQLTLWFPEAVCIAFNPATVSQLKGIMLNLLGQVDELFFVCGSVSASGTVEADLTKLANYASGNKTLSTDVTNAIAASSDAGLLALGKSSEATLTTRTVCQSGNATRAFVDLHDRCQPTQCVPGYTLAKADNAYTCVAPQTTAPEKEEEEEEEEEVELNSAEIAGLVVGLVGGLSMVVALVYFTCMITPAPRQSAQQKAPGQKAQADEPAQSNEPAEV